jgi:hypothetical protein
MSLISRVQNILLKPKEEWAVIDAEPATVQGIFTSYVMILAAIPPLMVAIGLFLFLPHGTIYGVAYGVSTTALVVGAVVQYILGLVSVYVLALIIDALAPSFGSTKDPIKALKVAAYYPTAVWLGYILMIYPPIGFLGVLVGGIYSLYLLFLGLPVLMKTPADKQVAYFVVTLVVAIVVIGIINMVGQRVMYGGMF